ncbi:hypothetical protein [Mycobacteroides abscessus]|uniref:hypothetical protein n=1 Tax=Mycobacteroides abscessus TaxID=36809 RepID=UPI0005B4CF15|nr:hypothetical protein [Mycobacteroides abscessus]
MPQTTASGFDMSFLDSGQTAGVFSDIASATDTWNTQLGAHIDELAQLSDSETISAAINQLGRAREGLSAGGYALAASSAALAAQKSADDQWRRAPQDDELEEARRAVTEASKELAAAADSQAAIAAEAKLKAAIEHSRDLNERRRQADKDFVDASGKVQERLREFNPEEGKNKKQKDKKDNENGRAVPGKKPELKASASPAPSNHRAPAAPGAPVTAPSSPAAPSGSPSSGSPASDAALTALLQRTGQLPPAQPAQQQQPPQQQPQTAPAAAAGPSSAPSPVSNPKSKVEGAINTDDIPGIAAAPVPMAMGPVAGPAPAAAASAAPAPATSGNSAADLSTDSNVSGRPDAQRGAFNQPHTSASGATGTATGAGTGTSTGLNQKGMQAAGMPATGMPMAGMPMAPGAAGSRGGTVKPVQAHQDSNVYEEGVVRGGTIAQNRPDFTEKG